MPVTFGAVGDIIAVVLVVKDLVDALDKARGSKVQHQAAMRELGLLERNLLEIGVLIRRHGDGATPELQGLCELAKEYVATCNNLVTTYKDRVEKYRTTFDQAQAPKRLSEAFMAIRWRFEEKEALEKFREELGGLVQNLQVLMITVDIKIWEVNRTEVHNKLDEAKRRDEAVISSHDTALQNIVDRIEKANQNIEAGNSMLGKLSEMLKLTEEPMMLEDPTGLIAPVPLQCITSWDAFNSMLERSFYNRQGYEKVKRREYGLQVRTTGEEIDQSRPWQCAFSPGQHIEMSFIFSEDDVVDSSCTTCPRCYTPSVHPNHTEIQCENCQILFRRITVVPDEGSKLQATFPSDSQNSQEPILQTESILTRDRKRKFGGITEPGEEDLTSFKRVRLIAQKTCAGKTQQSALGEGKKKQKAENQKIEDTEVAELRVLQKLLDQHEAKIAARTLAEEVRKAEEQAKEDADQAKKDAVQSRITYLERLEARSADRSADEMRAAEKARGDAELAKFDRLENLLISQQEAKVAKEIANREAAEAAKEKKKKDDDAMFARLKQIFRDQQEERLQRQRLRREASV